MMGASFIGAMMDHIMEGMMIPKVQIERVVGPILSMFLEDVLTETLRQDPLMSGRLTMICPEFPFKKDGSRQSTNIDWLMYNPDRRQLVFLELKTADSSVDLEQSAIYHARQTEVRRAGGSFLIEDLKELRDASGEHGKYSYIIDKKVAPNAAAIAACRDAVILYLVPRSAERKLQGHADKLLTFSMLSDSIPGPFAEEWKTIREHLCVLDESSKQVRNHKSDRPSQIGVTPNFAERVDFRSISELCRNRGDAVVVGFSGGTPALGRSSLPALQSRLFKWDHAQGGAGVKDPANWIRGSVFLRIIGELGVSLDSSSVSGEQV
jgi:hypothetical protein